MPPDYSREDWWCAIVHRFIRRARRPGFAAMGLRYGPREECTICGRGWGTAQGGDILE